MKIYVDKMKRKDIFYKTRKNIILISTMIVFLCLFVFVAIFQSIYISKTFNEIDEDIIRQKMMLEKDILKRPYRESINDKGDFIQSKHNIIPRIKPNVIVIVYKNSIPILITQNPYFIESEIKKFNINKLNEIVDIDANGYNFRGMRFETNEIDIEIIMNIDGQISSVKDMKNAIYISLILLLVVAMTLSIVLANKAIQPVKQAYNKQVFFVQDASHEMRTPLAVIKGKLELLARDLGTYNESSFEDISKMMSEIRGLEKLNNDLLLLSKEDIHSNIKITEIKLIEFSSDISEFYTDLAELQEKEFNVINKFDDIIVNWDYEKVKRCVVILLENAFKYSSKDGKIDFIIEDNNKNITISVIDNGIGIKEEDQPRIFDRFFRSSDIRATNIEGSGIGLSLLNSICKNLNIKVNLYSKYNEGSKFTLIVPKKM